MSSSSVHPTGQHPSPELQPTGAPATQRAEQVVASPVSVKPPQASPQFETQSPSQVSGASTTPSPQVLVHSASEDESQPIGQQPSPSAQATGSTTQRALQDNGVPVSVATSHPPAEHDAGHAPASVDAILGSQDSPGSNSPFPHSDVGADFFVESLPQPATKRTRKSHFMG